MNGKYAHPLFTYLKESVPFEGMDLSDPTNKIIDSILKEKLPEFSTGNAIRWNFTKFLVDRNGKVVKRFEPSVDPIDIEPYIQKLL